MDDLSRQEPHSRHNWGGSAVVGILALLSEQEVSAC
jgi:hypothetical protein